MLETDFSRGSSQTRIILLNASNFQIRHLQVIRFIFVKNKNFASIP